MEIFKTGEVIKCKVTAIESYGFFVSADYGYLGLVHISEITNGYVRSVENYVKIGEIINCRVIEVDNNNFHLKLSIKNINYKIFNDVVSDDFISLKNALPKWIEIKLKSIKD